jgi:hypothetical protein
VRALWIDVWVRSMLVALVAASAVCVTPSVPIPPPDVAKMTVEIDVDQGSVQFAYAPDPSYGGALVYLFNESIGEGIITTARDDGSVGPTEPFAASINDRLIVTFEIDEQLSSRCVIIGESVPLLECDL